ncbi:sugar phosphate isomerase/epimerase [Aldersonia sp. NBC_00410]|uniref:sugar phosphate isomerase/epimerase family protein n=1 Tax=Aldersonia sp. NBC_00410 TaxID=2975954 RepID=UPI002258F2BE|nr:sugar phosphate isomerase/epimerase [Aldersonia sp. NBC_00410]MCX5044117.1 sugar phosphate isomerase/epimerase [Aldersonia sp. NBC_00410]
MFHNRLGCSTISFRHQPLDEALATIRGLGFNEIDLGALPGVCDHVPHVLDEAAVAQVSGAVARSGLRVRSINGDIGDLNLPLNSTARAAREDHLDMLLALAEATGSDALVLPCGALDRTPVGDEDADLDRVAGELAHAAERARERGVGLWAETLHYFRLCWNIDRAQALTDRLAGSQVGVVMDFSHIVASGADPVDFVTRFADRLEHVHLRDAVPGNINLSIGNGHTDFGAGLAALADRGYTGHYSLELETRDVTHEERPTAASQAGQLVSALI